MLMRTYCAHFFIAMKHFFSAFNPSGGSRCKHREKGTKNLSPLIIFVFILKTASVNLSLTMENEKGTYGYQAVAVFCDKC